MPDGFLLRLSEREIHVRHRPLRLVRDLPQLCRRRTGHPGHEIRRELLLLRVVLRGRVVIELARERDLVLGGRQLFLQLRDVPRRLEIRIRLDDREQPAERAGELRLGCRRLRQRAPPATAAP